MEDSLLVRDDIVEGAVDNKGRPVSRSKSGGWRSATFIIGVELAERFAYYGIGSNLISYLTGPLQQSTAEAAENVNIWGGISYLLPLFGAFLADTYLGRYRTIIFATLLYILGLGLLTLSTVLPSLRPQDCIDPSSCPSPTRFQIFFFFAALYLVPFALSGHQPCVQAFGADQFDERDPEEIKSKSSFFNWLFFGICAGAFVSILILSYIQDNLSWGLGFGIPCISMMVALVIFLLGTNTYRHALVKGDNSLARVAQVVVASARRRFWRGPLPSQDDKSDEKHQMNAISVSSDGTDYSKRDWDECSASEVEDANELLQLAPIWATCLINAIIYAQLATLFVKQGSTMDRRIGPHFQIPAASLQMLTNLTIMSIMPLYDWLLVPLVRAVTKFPSGITMLQRIGIGLFVSVVSMVVAAFVESRRLAIGREYGEVIGAVPMSIWWLIPQYVLCGITDVFVMVGSQEFFYDQVPDGLRSVGLALYLSIYGVGNFLSMLLISAIDKVSKAHGESWFANNLNHAHLDYFYWLLAGLNALGLGFYLYFAKSYVYKTKNIHYTL